MLRATGLGQPYGSPRRGTKQAGTGVGLFDLTDISDDSPNDHVYGQ
jgi:hypothetical protein